MITFSEIRTWPTKDWSRMLSRKFTKEDIIIHLGGAGTERKIYKYDIDLSKIYFIDPLYKETKHPCYKFAISSKKQKLTFYKALSWQNSSTFEKYPNKISETFQVEAVTLDYFLKMNSISHINYLISNMEGGEYSLFKNTNWLNKVDCLMIDFHFGTVPNEEKEIQSINNLLNKNFKTLSYRKNDCLRILGKSNVER